MADCDPLITPEFLHLTTGADITDEASVEALIVIVSTLIGEELGACVVPADADMRLRIVCAQYTSYVMSSGSGGGGPAGNLRAEQIGDYRVEYQSSNKGDAFDLQVLRDMLASMYGASTYTVSTTDEVVVSGLPYFQSYTPGWDEVEDGERDGIAAPFYGDGGVGLDEAVGS